MDPAKIKDNTVETCGVNVSILVITPTLGVSPFLDETIQSVARFAGRASHVIVAPQAAVCGLEARYPGLVVITEGDPGGGIYGALAKAISSLGSGFDWFTWINDDDRLEPGFSVVNAAAEIATGVDVIYANVRFIDKNGMYVSDVPVARSARLVRACVETGQIPFTQQGGLIRTSSYFRAGGFSADYRLAADTELFFRLIARGARTLHVDRLAASYRLVKGQLSGNTVLQHAEHDSILAKYAAKRNGPKRLLVKGIWELTHLTGRIRRIRKYGFRSMRKVMDVVAR